jgi:hypothetical protein
MDNLKTRWKFVGISYVFLATVITLSYTTCSCNSVKKIRNSSVAKSDSAHVHTDQYVDLSKGASLTTKSATQDYESVLIETPCDTCGPHLLPVDGINDLVLTFNDQKLTVPRGSKVKFEKGTATQTKITATKNSDSIAHNVKDSASVDKQSKTVSINKETHRVSLAVIISLLIIGIIGLCLWDLHKNKPPFS